MPPTHPTGPRTPSTWAPVQMFSAVFGAVYLAVAASGFALTGLSNFAGHEHSTLIVFGVNPLHNSIHLVMAIAWIAAAPSLLWSQRVSIAVGCVFALVTVAGVLGVLEFLGMMGGLADPDNLLHLATSALALYFGTLATERRRGSAAPGAPAW
jgi:hypothetical protein